MLVEAKSRQNHGKQKWSSIGRSTHEKNARFNATPQKEMQESDGNWNSINFSGNYSSLESISRVSHNFLSSITQAES